MDPVVFFGLLGAFPPMLGLGVFAAQHLTRAVSRWRRARGAATKVTRVFGRIRALRPVSAPITKLPCAFAVTFFRGRGRSEVLKIFTGNDFLLESRDGVAFVRVEGAALVTPFGAIFAIVEPAPELRPSVLEKIARSPLADCRALYCHEVVFDSGDLVEVVGGLRTEPAPPDFPGRTEREIPMMRTLREVGGLLEIQPSATPPR